MRTTTSRTCRFAVVALVSAAFVTGCGASTSVVSAKLNKTTTTQEATSTVASTTTERATTTTEAQTTVPDTTAPDMSAPDSSDPLSSPSGSLPASIKDAFMRSCENGGGPAMCECVWNKIEGELSIQALEDVGNSGTMPADLQQKIVAATTSCITNPTT